MKRTLLRIAFAVGFIFSSGIGYAQIVQYTFTGNANATAPVGLTGGTFTVTGASTVNTTTTFRTNNWTTNGSRQTGFYHEVILTPTGGSTINFTTFIFDYTSNSGSGASNGGPNNWELRSSNDAFGSALGSGSGIQGNSGTASVDISALPSAATTFRIYFWAAENGSGTLDLDNVIVNGAVNTFANYTFTGNKTATSQPANGTAGAFSVAGAGTQSANVTTYQTNNWSTSNSFQANDFYSVTITPNAGYKIDYTTFVFDWVSSTTTGPDSWALRSSADGFQADIATVSGLRGKTVLGNSVNITALANVQSAITFHLHIWNSGTSATGTMDLDNVNIGGAFSSIPPANTVNSPLTFSGITNALTTVNWTPAAGNISLATTALSGSGTVAQLTFAAQTAPPFPVGSTIFVAGAVPAGYNGSYTVTACTTTQVSYNNTTTGNTTQGTITGTGTGTSRLVIAKLNSSVGSPTLTNGTTYSANAAFGSGASLGGGFVVYNGTGTNVPVTALGNGDYFYKVYTYDGVAGQENYSAAGVETNQGTTPSAQPTAMTFTLPLANGTGHTVGWTAVSGVTGYLVVRRAGSAPAHTANTPVDGTSLSTTYAVGQTLLSGTIAYNGTGSSFADTGLSPGVNYFYDVYSYNGTNAGIVFLTGTTPTPLGGNRRTNAPAVVTAASGVSLSAIGTSSIKVNWTNGNSSVATTTNTGSCDGTNATLAFSSAQTAPPFPVGSKIYVTGVAPAGYNTGAGGATVVACTTTSVTYANTTTAGTSQTGAGAVNSGGRLLLVKQGVDFIGSDDPQLSNSYTNTGLDYSTGTIVGAARQVYFENYTGTGGTTGVTVAGLSSNTKYYFKVYEFNGNSNSGTENYNTATASVNATVLATLPSDQASDIAFTATGSTGTLFFKWTKGTDATGGRIVVVKPTNAFVPADDPTNGTAYIGNLAFGSAPVVGPNGAKVVFNEAAAADQGSTGITVTGLANATHYYVRVYEFNGSAGGQNYLTTTDTNNPNDRFTIAATAPVTQASGISFTTVTSSSVMVKWSGNGSGTGGRILLVKPASTFGGTDKPVAGQSFSNAAGDYATGTPIGGAGSKVVYVENAAGTGGSSGVTVANLLPGTQYYFAVLSYNGTSGGGDGTENYNTSTAGTNTLPRYTLVNTLPGAQTTGITFTPTTSATSLFLKWTKGTGLGGRIVIISPSPISAVTDNPTNGVSYTGGSLAYGSAPGIGTGSARVVYNEAAAGTGGTAGITVTGLAPSTPYYFKVFEFDGVAGTGSEVYLMADGASNNPNNATTLTQPTVTFASTTGSFVGFVGANANITLSFNVPMSLAGGGAIIAGNVSTFVQLIDNTTSLATPFTAMFNGTDLITLIPNDSHIPGNTLTGSRIYKVTLANNAIQSSAESVLLAGTNSAFAVEILPEPANQPTFVAPTSTTTSITLSWVDAVTSQLPENYLIVGVEQGVGTFPIVGDANDLVLDPDLSDGTFVAKVPYGVQTLLVNTGLKSDKYYDFRVYSYTNERTAIDYKTSPTILGYSNVLTQTGTLTASNTGGGTATLTSTTISLLGANANSANFSFVVRDDNTNAAIDNAPTRIASITLNRDAADQTVDWTKVIAGVVLTDGSNTIDSQTNGGNFSINQNFISITGITATNPALGLIPDNTGAGSNKTYQIKIWLRTDIQTVSAFDIDNSRIVFNVRDVDFNTTAPGTNTSHFTSSTATTVSGNNTVQVTADRYSFLTVPSSGVAGFIFLLQIGAVDVSGNIDLDQNSAITVTAPTKPPTGNIIFTYSTPVGAAQNFINGRRPWGQVMVSAGGAGAAGNYVFQINDNDGALPNFPPKQTSIINFGAPSNASKVVENTGFGYVGGIAYGTYRHASPFTTPAAPPADAIKVAEFFIQDGGSTLADPDAIGTTVTSISFGVTNPGNLQAIGLYDGTNIVASQPASTGVTFSGLNLLAEDIANGGTGQKTFALYVSFNNNVVDNEHFEFQILNVVTGNGGSTFPFTDGALGTGGAKSTTNALLNTVSVFGDRLKFVQQPPVPPAFTFLGATMSPTPSVEVVDALGSRDLNDRDGISINLTSPSGTLVGIPSATISLGLGSFSAVRHSAIGTGLILGTTNGSGLINASNGTAFDIKASNASTITINSFTPPQNIDYYPINEGSDIVNSSTSIVVAKFDINDGGGSADADVAPTTVNSITLDLGSNWNYIKRIELWDATGTTTSFGTEQSVSGQLVTFNGLSLSAADGTTPFTFSVRVSFTTNVVDNQQFTIAINTATTTPNISSTIPSPGGAITTTLNDDNRIEVIAKKLVFTTQPNTPLLAKADFTNPAQLPIPVIKALDLNNILDQDYTTNVTLAAPSGLSQTSIPTNPSNGIYTLPTAFNWTSVSPTNDGTLTATSGSLTSAVSNPVAIQAGTATRILPGAASPATISSNTVSPATPVAVFNFDISDDPGGTANNNNDRLPTLLSQVVITANAANNTISDWTQVLGGTGSVILSDGNPANNLTGTVTFIAGVNKITFSGIPSGAGQLGEVLDNQVKHYNLLILLNNPMPAAVAAAIDGKQFQFELLQANVSLASNSTKIVVGDHHDSGNADVIDVVATHLRFLSPASATSASLNTNFPGVQVEAVDNQNNRDINFTGASSTVRLFTNASASAVPIAVTTTAGPTVGSTTFSSGLLTFSNSFQYATGSNGLDVTLTIDAGPTAAACGVSGVICGTSPTITLLSSFESWIKPDPSYSYLPTISYVDYQTNDIQATDIGTFTKSYEISRMLLSDGDADAVAGDTDGAATVLTDIDIRIADAADVSTLGAIKRMAIYSSGVLPGATELAEKAVTVTELTQGYVRFSGLNIIAPDDNTIPISIRVSFNNTVGTIVDKTLLRVSVTNAVLAGGSSFLNTPPNIAGVPGGLKAPLGSNFLNVIATKLDFTTQPAAVAGFNEPFNGGIVEARDQFQILDKDFVAPALLSSAVTTTGSFNFVGGIANLNGMLYNATGNGTLTVTAGPGPLSSNTNNMVGGWTNVSTPCNHVDVIHTTTSIATGGVTTATNLAGNSTGKVIFGVTFNVPYKITGEPKLQKFTISFSNSINGVLNNLKVFESQSTTYSGGSATDVTLPAIGATLSTASNGKSVDVIFPVGTPRDLSLPANSTLTYFLMVDIDPNASGSTPAIQPSVVDGGAGSSTNNNILTSTGSSTSATIGQNYTFASIFPPILTSSIPAAGQLNVDPNQSTLQLFFSVPVWSLDQKVFLTDQTAVPNTTVQLNAINGQYPLTTPNPLGIASPLTFSIPGALIADHVYYVTIAQGNQATLAGIMDENNNVYQGISYPGTLYFKVATTSPPKLLGLLTTPLAQSNPSITFTSTTGAIIDATFDQRGTAFYLVVDHGSPAPNNAQIANPSGNGYSMTSVFANGSFQINQTTPISQFGVVTTAPAKPFVAGNQYDVWMYAQNDALPTGFSTTAPYGGAPTFTAGGTGPTIVSNNVPADGTLVALNNPTVSICNNSYQILNSPIVLTEGSTNQFTTAGSQSLNIVLPAGFQFDVSLSGTQPKYGTLQLIGGDFGGNLGQLSFLGNSILKVTFDNAGTTTMDKIIISGLRVLSTGTSSGPMFRLGGLAISSIGDSQTIGTLSSFDAPVIGFTNSYSTSLVPAPTSVVTSIPDNANPATLTLTPTPATGSQTLFQLGDFGPSSFSGQGVNINILTLSAVTLDVPFNITVTHTDNNGCISNNAIQYTVYDHTKAINITDALLPAGATVVSSPLNTYCANNDKFVVGQVNRPTYGRPGHVRFVDYKNLAPFYLMSLTADLPAAGPAQIMAGASWKSVVQSLPVVIGSHTVGSGTFKDYNFDDAVIADANFLSGGAIPDPYANFRSTITSVATGSSITYYTGGSLGFIELTGTFQSRTNSQVIVPRVQRLEIFLPAVPVVDASLPSFIDITDPTNPPYTVSGTGPVNNPGTLVYCEAGGLINIYARPAAVPGQSVGTFAIVDAISGTPISTTGFTDNTNGSAVLDPSVVSAKNGYADIKIVYTFQDNKSPCSSSSYQIVRITPNPVGGFIQSAVISNYTPTITSYCVGNQINFDSNAAGAVPKTTISSAPVTSPATPANTIQTYSWNFGDVNSSTNIASGITQSHTFGLAQTYAVTFNATSNWGCPSVPYVQNTKVGGIPNVKIKFDGVSTADVFNFSSNGSTVSSNDTFAALDWDFGDGTAPVHFTYGSPPSTDPGTNFTHSYPTPGRKVVDMKLTSTIGCVNSLSLTNLAAGLSTNDDQLARTVVVLPRGTTSAGSAAYQQDFESSDGNFQVWFAGTPGLPVIFAPGTPATPLPSWRYNAPAGAVIKPDPNGLNGPNGAGTGATGKYWKTYDPANQKYTGFERSALYSPSFDITSLGTPMISFSSFVQMESSDGVIVEYSTDNLNIADPLKKWNVLGQAIGEGVNWFTDKGIAAKPGNQVGNDFGWSGVSNTSWQTSKHTLDEISATGSTTKVVFRFALGSAKAVPTVEGFAIDNVRIGDRTRTILLESFANSANADPNEATQNTAVAAFPGTSIGTQVIKVNYHVSFPGDDPFNMDNPADPSARALYYNITKTPKSRLDGFPDEEDRDFTTWSTSSYGTRSLQLAQADISPTATNANGKISIKVDVKAVFDLPANTILQVAVVEKSVPLSSLTTTQKGLVKTSETSFAHVLKRMLPTAAGTRFGTTLPQGSTRSFPATAGGLDWIPDPTKLYLPANDLRVVVFLQNETSGEVYQVNYIDVPDPAVITGLEPIPADQIILYPNPANREFTVLFPGQLGRAAGLQLIDQVGKVNLSTTVSEGSQSKVVNTQDLAPGLYILQIETGPGVMTHKKVMVVHEK